VVTGAGVLLIVGGVLGILLGILLLAGAGAVRGRGAGGLFTVVGFISIVVGTVQSYAGVQVLNLREIGRTLGIAIAAVAPSRPAVHWESARRDPHDPHRPVHHLRPDPEQAVLHVVTGSRPASRRRVAMFLA
jgi:uncharacterized membrane protein YccC